MSNSIIPGELLPGKGKIILNEGRKTQTLKVKNTGDRPVQVGSHFHFFEVNKVLDFPREKAFGMRLDIPAGTAVRFEPGDEKEVDLVAFIPQILHQSRGVKEFAHGSNMAWTTCCYGTGYHKGLSLLLYNLFSYYFRPVFNLLVMQGIISI